MVKVRVRVIPTTRGPHEEWGRQAGMQAGTQAGRQIGKLRTLCL